MLAPRTLNGLLDIAAIPSEAIPVSARAIAHLSLYDWLAVTRAGEDEPVARIVRDLVADEGGREAASVVGLNKKVPARAAALANGTASHALDYDDTHFAHVGHPSVAILPAALAVAEALDAPAAAVLDALLIGAEASIRVGMVLGRPHYDRGFHQTATAGAFGATVAAARVIGLTRDEARNALSLVATRASGLKSQFGSMGKPFNAGIAASNGVEAAELAKRAFISCDDGVGGPQGFIDAHVDVAFEDAAWASPPPATFLFEDVKHKLHACCHGLHATIEALRQAQRTHGLDPAAVAAVDIRVNPRWLKVCDIKQPRTGLEAKFSYAMVTAMTLSEVDTASDAVYADELCRDAALVAFLPKVAVTGDEAIGDTGAVVRIERGDAPAVMARFDLAERLPADVLQRRLRDKATALVGREAAEALWRDVAELESMSASRLARNLRAGT
ncbi:MmgE/PrpD family protein [Roseiarcus sp.]|uniref:MmgE/PrpD family protein n=1 Tax=Roseiarcus sp. TaxID=1969460 RepID=UPI003F98CE4F